MTRAVCYKCGAIKFGAFCPCQDCSCVPTTEDDLALSLAMTDHYFDMATLDQIGAAVRDGNPPELAPETLANLREMVREASAIMAHHDAKADKRNDSAGDESPRDSMLKKKPWWKFW